jgi:hypothetical protein
MVPGYGTQMMIEDIIHDAVKWEKPQYKTVLRIGSSKPIAEYFASSCRDVDRKRVASAILAPFRQSARVKQKWD